MKFSRFALEHHVLQRRVPSLRLLEDSCILCKYTFRHDECSFDIYRTLDAGIRHIRYIFDVLFFSCEATEHTSRLLCRSVYLLVIAVRCSSAKRENFTNFSFSCFCYVTQVTRISLEVRRTPRTRRTYPLLILLCWHEFELLVRGFQ